MVVKAAQGHPSRQRVVGGGEGLVVSVQGRIGTFANVFSYDKAGNANTLHPAPQILHSKPCTLHPAPLHPEFLTLGSICARITREDLTCMAPNVCNLTSNPEPVVTAISSPSLGNVRTSRAAPVSVTVSGQALNPSTLNPKP
jgi:hypothetical protein